MCKGKILFWGAGPQIEIYKNWIDYDKNNVIGIVDNDKSKCGKENYGFLTYKPSDIQNIDFDHVVITCGSWLTIFNQLQDLGVSQEKICIFLTSFMCMGHFEREIMKISQSDTLITGLSYGYYLNFNEIKCANFAYPSQDLYFDNCMGRLAFSKKVPNPFKRVVIVLSHYSLEYDRFYSCSELSAQYTLIDQLKGISEEVSLTKSREIYSLEDKIPNLKALYDINLKSYKQIFNEKVFSLEGNVQDEQDFADAAILLSNKNYPKTVLENRKLVENYIEFCLQNNSRPIIVVVPQHKVFRKHFSKRITTEFEGFLEQLKTKYDITIFNDYCMDFEKEDFRDGHHLNRRGYEKYGDHLEKKILKMLDTVSKEELAIAPVEVVLAD